MGQIRNCAYAEPRQIADAIYPQIPYDEEYIPLIKDYYLLEVFVSKKHTILMLLCCVIGMGGAAAIFFFGIPVSRVFTTLLVLLCPISHILMMKFMMKGHQHEGNEQPVNDGQHVHATPVNEHR